MSSATKVFADYFGRELRFLPSSRWDLAMLTAAPLCLLLIMAAMFVQGVPRELPIAVVDEDGTPLSRQIVRNLRASPGVTVEAMPTSLGEARQLAQATNVWAVVHITRGAEQRLVRGEGAQVVNYYNEAFYSIGGAASSAISSAVNAALLQRAIEGARDRGLPFVRADGPGLQITPLFNPQTSYELFLEPLAVMAVMHLLLACAVASAVGREFTGKTMSGWLHASDGKIVAALLGKIAPYVLVFWLWGLVWLAWISGIRGWSIQGSLTVLLAAQFLLQAAYAAITVLLTVATRDMATSLSAVAIYAGSSLSFSDVTLPVNGAPVFTRVWSEIIPFTAYARAQMEQMVIGSPWTVSMLHLGVLVLFTLVPAAISIALLFRSAAEMREVRHELS